MTPLRSGQESAPYRRLLPLTLGVLALHLWLLQLRPAEVVSPAAGPVHRFVLREVNPPAAKVVERAAPVPPQPAPARDQTAAAAPAAASRPSEQAQSEQAPPPPAPAVEPEAAALPQAQEPPPSPPPSGIETGIASPPAFAAPGTAWTATRLPEPARIHYEVLVSASGFVVRGEAQLHWRHDGRQYDARLEVSGPLLPNRVQRSTGRIGAQGLEPLRFSDSGRRGEKATHFVRDKGKLVFSNNQPEAPLEAGAQDRLSVVVQLAVIVAAEPQKYPAGTAISIPTAGTGDSETWIFIVEGEEDLQLPGGSVHTLKLQRQPRKEFDQKVELWLAPRMDYAPVRLRLTNPNGDSVDQRWSSTDKG